MSKGRIRHPSEMANTTINFRIQAKNLCEDIIDIYANENTEEKGEIRNKDKSG